MSVTAHWYGNALKQALSKGIDYLNDTIKVILCTSSYTPNQDTDIYKDVVNPTEATGTGYTAGGVALASKAINYVTAANATAWAPSTPYNVGDIVRPTTSNGYVYQCIQAGTSGTTAPTWSTTEEADITDNTVKWQMIGTGYTSVVGANVTWASSTITARYAVIYDDTPATNKPLLGWVDFGTDQSSNNGNFTITWSGSGIFTITAS